MWINVPFTEQLLNLISVVQAFANFRRSYGLLMKSTGGEQVDWREETRQFYVALDEKLLQSFHLHKNDDCFERILGFTITPEMRSTEYDKLPKRFNFRTWAVE